MVATPRDDGVVMGEDEAEEWDQVDHLIEILASASTAQIASTRIENMLHEGFSSIKQLHSQQIQALIRSDETRSLERNAVQQKMKEMQMEIEQMKRQIGDEEDAVVMQVEEQVALERQALEEETQLLLEERQQLTELKTAKAAQLAQTFSSGPALNQLKSLREELKSLQQEQTSIKAQVERSERDKHVYGEAMRNTMRELVELRAKVSLQVKKQSEETKLPEEAVGELQPINFDQPPDEVIIATTQDPTGLESLQDDLAIRQAQQQQEQDEILRQSLQETVEINAHHAVDVTVDNLLQADDIGIGNAANATTNTDSSQAEMQVIVLEPAAVLEPTAVVQEVPDGVSSALQQAERARELADKAMCSRQQRIAPNRSTSPNNVHFADVPALPNLSPATTPTAIITTSSPTVPVSSPQGLLMMPPFVQTLQTSTLSISDQNIVRVSSSSPPGRLTSPPCIVPPAAVSIYQGPVRSRSPSPILVSPSSQAARSSSPTLLSPSSSQAAPAHRVSPALRERPPSRAEVRTPTEVYTAFHSRKNSPVSSPRRIAESSSSLGATVRITSAGPAMPSGTPVEVVVVGGSPPNPPLLQAAQPVTNNFFSSHASLLTNRADQLPNRSRSSSPQPQNLSPQPQNLMPAVTGVMAESPRIFGNPMAAPTPVSISTDSERSVMRVRSPPPINTPPLIQSPVRSPTTPLVRTPVEGPVRGRQPSPVAPVPMTLQREASPVAQREASPVLQRDASPLPAMQQPILQSQSAPVVPRFQVVPVTVATASVQKRPPLVAPLAAMVQTAPGGPMRISSPGQKSISTPELQLSLSAAGSRSSSFERAVAIGRSQSTSQSPLQPSHSFEIGRAQSPLQQTQSFTIRQPPSPQQQRHFSPGAPQQPQVGRSQSPQQPRQFAPSLPPVPDFPPPMVSPMLMMFPSRPPVNAPHSNQAPRQCDFRFVNISNAGFGIPTRRSS